MSSIRPSRSLIPYIIRNFSRVGTITGRFFSAVINWAIVIAWWSSLGRNLRSNAEGTGFEGPTGSV